MAKHPEPLPRLTLEARPAKTVPQRFGVAPVSPSSQRSARRMAAHSRRRASSCSHADAADSVPVQPHNGSDSLGIMATLGCFPSTPVVFGRTSQKNSAEHGHTCHSFFEWNRWEFVLRIADFVRVNSRGNRRANIPICQKPGQNWALVDTQRATIALSLPNLVAPFPGEAQGTFGKAFPIRQRRTRRCERGPSAWRWYLERLFSCYGPG